MDADRWQRIQEVFEEALERPEGERRSWIDEVCSSDPELKAEVLSLLEADTEDEVAGIVEKAARAAAAEDEAAPAGEVIGPYRILEPIGRGGMGTVYLAERGDGQFEQRVAIKVVRERLSRPDLAERFLAERQILARLQHPNIARLLDGGTTDEGSPYLVMEHIEGLHLDRYCERHRLPVRRALELFLDVCDAVQYAHRNLIVHRDLKPSNVLVTDAGVPKLLDFGVARLLDPAAGLAGGSTRTVHRMLTPEYASPEQIRGEPVSTASDVYSLGVMLYRLLASRSPYRPTDDSARELERAICETDPEPPSAAVTGKGEPGDARAKGRDLAGDLDNIVLMAMRKEPERRYGSVAELSEDLTRYLEGHPVKARKAGWSYRAGKFVLRNKLAVGATAVILALLVGFGVTMSVQAARLAAERDRATRAQETAESTTGFLEDLFKVSDPDESRGDTITAREILDAGEPRIREELEGQPIVQARLLGSIGVVYGNLGLYRDARRILEDALSLREASLPADHPDIAKSLSDLGKVLTEMDEYDEALPVHERALEIRQASLGPGHPQVAQSLVSLGSVLRLQGDFEGARERLQRAIEIYEKSPDTEFDQLRAARNNLAVLYEKMEDYDRSIPMLELVVQETEAELGDDHPDVARGLNNLAVSLARRGDYERALPYLERATAVMEKTLGPDHPQMATAYVNLAFVHGRTGDIERKMELERKALAIEEENLGPDHPRVGMTLINHGRSLLSVNRFAEAQETLERALEILEEGLGADHAHTAGAMRALVEALVFQWKLGGRDGLLERSRQATARQVGEDDPRYADTLFHLGMLSRHDGRDDEAEAHFRRALEIRQQKRPDDPNLSTVLTELAILAARRGNDDEADEHRRQAGEIRGEAPESPKTLYASARYEAARGEREAAMELLQEASGQGYPTDGVERDPDLAILNTGDHRAAQPAL